MGYQGANRNGDEMIISNQTRSAGSPVIITPSAISANTFRMGGLGQTFAQLIKSLFANNEQGFAYDPNDLTTMFQDAAGTIPVTGAGQAVGLMLDKSKGLALGPEKVTNGDFAAGTQGWVLTGNTTVNTAGARLTGILADSTIAQTLDLEVGKTYKISASVTEVSGSPAINVPTASRFTGNIIFTATRADTNLQFRCFGSTIPADVTLSNISVREVKGNHAYQTTSAARPVLRDTPRRIDFDAVDDKLITNLPAQLTDCTVVRSVPNVGTQILTGQTIPATYEDNKDHCGLIAINRALTASETAAITREFNKRAGM